MKVHNLKNEAFIHACRDYFYLIDRNYPERGSLKLIGDRYKLDGDQRTVLYRGISSAEKSEMRSMLLIDSMKGKQLIIDGYNVIFTLLNYRLGRIMFIGTDHILRDAGSLHGKIRNELLLKECTEQLLEYVSGQKPGSVQIYLDSPVSHSLKHAETIRRLMGIHHLNGNCNVVRSADWALKQYDNGIIATSDTVIIEKSGRPVVDLPRSILESNFQVRFIQLNDLIKI